MVEVGIMKKKLLEYHKKYDLHHSSSSYNKILAELSFSEKEVERVSFSTMKQWQSKEWYIQKAGFISASKAKIVFGAQSSLDKGHKRNITKLVEEIACPKYPFQDLPIPVLPEKPQNPRDWGLKHEDTARINYHKVETKKHHNLRLISKGFLISQKKPMVGASVDNIRTCACAENCLKTVVEYKCPWRHRHLYPKEAFLTPEVGGQRCGDTFSLSVNSKYYFQVQLQMFVCNLTLCDLVVWTEQGIFAVSVTFDSNFVKSLCSKLEDFWLSHVLPFMVNQLTGSELKNGMLTLLKNITSISSNHTCNTFYLS